MEYDIKVLEVFLRDQLQLFTEPVADSYDEAREFLEDCMAVIVDSKEEVWEYFDGECVDMEGADEDTILEADEVFDIGDGRYLIVES